MTTKTLQICSAPSQHGQGIHSAWCMVKKKCTCIFLAPFFGVISTFCTTNRAAVTLTLTLWRPQSRVMTQSPGHIYHQPVTLRWKQALRQADNKHYSLMACRGAEIRMARWVAQGSTGSRAVNKRHAYAVCRANHASSHWDLWVSRK